MLGMLMYTILVSERRQAVPVPRLITSYCIILVVAWYAHSIHITLALAPHGFGTCQSGK